ncbi:O-antigen ligase family protein [Aquabacterium sp.]|uniref:O-antigen ligase family protein n=1 Tax=Aquabacterium sp. TaxID=1872578 RepID=UPI004037DE0A
MARQTPVASGMKAWPRTDVGRTRVAVAPVMIQLRRYGLWLTVALIFCMVALPSYAEIRPGGLPNISPARWLRFALVGLTLILLLIKPFRVPLTEFSGAETRRLWRMVAVFFSWYFVLNIFLNYSNGFFINDIINNILPPWFAFAFAAIYIRREEDFTWLFRALALAAIVVVCVMPIEFVLKRNVFEKIMSSEGWNQVGLVDQSRDGVYRVKGTFEHPLLCAQFLITVGVAFFAKGFFDRAKGRLLWMFLGALTLGSVVLTYTRSSMVLGAGLVGVIFVVKFMAWTSKFSNRLTATVLRVQLMWLPFLLMVAALWVFELLRGRTADESISSEARVSMLIRGVPAIFDSPVWGHGSGEGAKIAGFKGYFGSYFLDNIYLVYALDYGLIYCLLFMAILGFAIWRLCPSYEELRAPQANTGVRAGMAMALMASATMLVVHASVGLHQFIFALIGASLCLPGRQFRLSPYKRRGL